MPNEPRPPLEVPAPTPLSPPDDFPMRLAELGIELRPEAVSRLGDYLARLLAMNERMNLTAILEPAEAWERHVLDALTLLPLLADLPGKARLVDVGSGGGVPGIPIAIARPDLRVSLVEATQKKASFLSMVSGALGLGNVSVQAGRAEQLATRDLAGRFDAVTARAVARLELLIPLTVPFARPGGRILLIKGQRADEELAEATRALERARAKHEQTIPTPTGRIVVLRRS